MKIKVKRLIQGKVAIVFGDIKDTVVYSAILSKKDAERLFEKLKKATGYKTALEMLGSGGPPADD